MRALQALVAVAALTAAADARGGTAESVGVVAVAPEPGPTPELAEATQRLRDALSAYHPGVVDARELRERMTGPSAGASLAELERAYEGARVAYVRGDYGGSIATLSAILDDLERLPDGPAVFAAWQKVVLRLARTEVDLGEEDAARALAARLVRAAPDVVVDRRLHPPRVVDHVEAARAELASDPTASLSVASSAPGARVYVDGRDVGAAPVRVVLARGRHRVSGAHGETRFGPVEVDLAGDDDLLLDFALFATFRPGSGPGLALPDGDDPGRLVAIGAHLRVDGLVAVKLANDGEGQWVVAALLDVRRGTTEREGRVRMRGGALPVGGTTALAEFLVTGAARPGMVEIPRAAPGVVASAATRPAEPERKPVDLGLPPLAPTGGGGPPRAAGWTALGTGIATVGLTTLGALAATSASRSYADARALRSSGELGPADRAAHDRYVASGDASMRHATVLWVGAAASFVASGVLGYVHYRRTGEIGPFRF